MKLIKFCTSLILLFIGFHIYAQTTIPSSSRTKSALKKNTERLKTAFEEKNLTFGNPIFMRIFKESNELELWVKSGEKYKLFKTYEICYYSGDLGPKTQQGDGQSPEGFYYVKPGQLNPWSNFLLSFNIGYPNKYDKAHECTGNYIMVHGNCVSIGCYAMTDPVIEELWTIMHQAFKNGQPFFRIHIFPFPLEQETLSDLQNSKHYAFWKNLQDGYEYFEENHVPPNVEVVNKKYVFD